MLLEIRILIDSKELLGVKDLGKAVDVMYDIIDPTSSLETLEIIGVINRGD